MMYFGCLDGILYAVTLSTGSILWQVQTGNVIETSPSVGSDGTVYIGSSDSSLYAINGINGSLKWVFQTENSIYGSTSIGSDGTIYFASGTKLYALTDNRTSYAIKWSYTFSIYSDSTPSIGADGVVYFSCPDGYTYAFNGTNGALLWKLYTGASILSAPAIGSDGTLYVTNNTETLSAITGISGIPQSPAICFVKGTLIETNRGLIPIEDITNNDSVLIGGKIQNTTIVDEFSTSKVIHVVYFESDTSLPYNRPIRIKKDTFGLNTPSTDLYLSPLHAIKIGNELVQVHNLVNKDTITEDFSSKKVCYYHIFTGAHEMLYANNLLCETLAFDPMTGNPL